MKTIFVVDDNNTNLLMAKEALDGTYRALAIPSAEKMFELMAKIKPDLILLDVEMPGMDGYTALTKLKQIEKTAKIPVIMITAYTSDLLEAQALEAGAADFITKPFAKPVLLNRVKAHLRIAEMGELLETVADLLFSGNFKAAAEYADEYMRKPR